MSKSKIGPKEAQLQKQRAAERPRAHVRLANMVEDLPKAVREAKQDADAKKAASLRKAAQDAAARAATFKAPSPKSELVQALSLPENGDVPEFLKRSETPEQAEARRKKYEKKDSTGGLKVITPTVIPDAVKKAIQKDLKEPRKTKAQIAAEAAEAARVKTRESLAKDADKAKAEKPKAKNKTTKAKASAKTASTSKSAHKRHVYDWKGAAEAAAKGHIPDPPDFSANTHKSYRPLLAEVVALVKARDLAKLQHFKITATCTSPRAVRKYRDLAVVALKAKKAA